MANCLWYATGNGNEKRCSRPGCWNRLLTEYPPDRCRGICQAVDQQGTEETGESPAPASLQRVPCVHRGDESRRQQCPTCCGSVKIKVFACSTRGECTLSKIIGNIPCCANCAQFEPESGGQSSPVIP